MRCLVLLLLPATLAAQSGRFHQGEFHGRDAYFLENARIRIAALRGAGLLAKIRLKSGDPRVSVNPMRIPHFPTSEGRIEVVERETTRRITLKSGRTW